MDAYFSTEQLDALQFLIDDVPGLEDMAAHIADILQYPQDTNMITIMYEELELLAETLEDLHDWIPLVAQIDAYLED